MPMYISIWFVNKCTTKTQGIILRVKSAWKLKWIESKASAPPPPAAPYWATTLKAAILAHLSFIPCGRLEAFEIEAPPRTNILAHLFITTPGILAHLFITHGDPCSPFHHTWGSLLTFSSHVGILAHLFITRGDPCSPFHHTWGSLLTFSSHAGILAHLFHHTWESLLTFSSHVGILAHLFITRGNPCSPFHHTWGSLLTFSSHVRILAHLFIARGDPCSPFHHTRGSLLTFSSHMGILAHLFITRGDPCSPFHHTRGSLLTFSSRGDPCSPFHHTWGSLLTFSSHAGILAHLFITRGDPCSPFHHTWGSLLTFHHTWGSLLTFSSLVWGSLDCAPWSSWRLGLSQAWLKLFADSWFAHDDSSSPHPDIADASTCMILFHRCPFLWCFWESNTRNIMANPSAWKATLSWLIVVSCHCCTSWECCINPKFRGVETKTARFYSIKSWLAYRGSSKDSLMTLELDTINPLYTLKNEHLVTAQG